jgi:hypothetical protein
MISREKLKRIVEQYTPVSHIELSRVEPVSPRSEVSVHNPRAMARYLMNIANRPSRPIEVSQFSFLL